MTGHSCLKQSPNGIRAFLDYPIFVEPPGDHRGQSGWPRLKVPSQVTETEAEIVLFGFGTVLEAAVMQQS